jgi:TolB-like protein
MEPAMSFLGEIKRRKVFQVAAVYAVVAWLLIQVVATIEAPLNLPDWFDTTVIVLLGLGFPITLIVSWAFNLTAQGLVRDHNDANAVPGQKRSLEYALIGLLVFAVGFLFFDNYFLGGPSGGAEEFGSAEGEAPVTLPLVGVLPCDNLSPREEDAYFAAGMHDAIQSQLVKISGLLVVPRTSMLQYAGDNRPSVRQVAAEQGAQALLECSVRYAGTSVQVTASLVDPESNSSVFSNAYPADISNVSEIIEIQADIAMNIANAMQATYSDEEQARVANIPTESFGAYALYMQARNVPNSIERLALLDRAIAADPEFALAHAEKAVTLSYNLRDTTGATASRDDPSELASMIIESAGRALAIDAAIGRAHFALAEVHMQFWRWTEAQAEYSEALHLDPNDPEVLYRYGWFSTYTGQFEQAIRLARRLIDLGERARGLFNVGYANFAEGNIDAAVAAYRELAIIAPAFSLAHAILGNAEQRLGNRTAAMDSLRLSEALYGDNINPLSISELAHAYSRLGMDAEVQRLNSRFDELSTGDEIGAGVSTTMFLALRDEERAYDSLTRAVKKAESEQADSGFNALMSLKLKLSGDPVLSTRRFQALLDRIGRLD